MQSDEVARRAYWTQQLEAAYAFMFESILPYPVVECGEPFVSLRESAEQADVVVAFSSLKHVNDLDRLFYLREGQIPNFLGAAKKMNELGWVLRVEDGYRTREIQKYLGLTPKVFDAVLQRVMWELGGKVPSPEFMFRRCSALVATVPKFATHMSGSAIDISVMSRNDPALNSPFVSALGLRHRKKITALMRDYGFVEYPWEFWHYSSGDAYDQFLRKTGKPAIYGAVDWDPVTNVVSPMADATTPLNSEEEIRTEIEAALQRLSK
jgi:D-alanyl-D-alanine dipeptidase